MSSVGPGEGSEVAIYDGARERTGESKGDPFSGSALSQVVVDESNRSGHPRPLRVRDLLWRER
jgi:hypothetical protein